MKELKKRLAKVEFASQRNFYLWREMRWTEAEFQEQLQNVVHKHPDRECIWISWST